MGPPRCGAPLLASTSPRQPVERRYVQIRSPPVQVHPTNGTWGSPRKSDAHPCNEVVYPFRWKLGGGLSVMEVTYLL